MVSVQSEFRCQFSSGQLRENNSGRSTRISKQGDSHGKFVVEVSSILEDVPLGGKKENRFVLKLSKIKHFL
jgi:hypothetical protein